MIKTHQVKIEPNAHMRRQIERLFNYRRYCWNQALGLWNDMYDESLIMNDKQRRPNGSTVRNELVKNKNDWQYMLSSRVLQQAVSDLEKAWKNSFNPNMPNHVKPRFKSKKNYKPTFTTDMAKLVNDKLILDKPQGVNKADWYGIRLREKVRFDGVLRICTITQKSDGLYASLIIETINDSSLPEKQGVAGVDVNVKRFNYNDGVVDIYPNALERYYQRITYYQRVLARKRLANPRNFQTKRYTAVKTKLRRDYQKVSQLQNDILQKFTSHLIQNYNEIHIEDLNVRAMTMSKRMGKNLHRSLFGRLSTVLSYKCQWNTRKLVLVDRLYPSTQICSECGYQKTNESYGGKQTLAGDSIYHQHQVYRCYECGAVLDRDENAVKNIINFKQNAG